jgi:hypothetical protein
VARVLCRLELGYAVVGDRAAARACRVEWQTILDELRLDETCLHRPRFLDWRRSADCDVTFTATRHQLAVGRMRHGPI